MPATVYVALFTVSPGDSGGGTEATGGSYARVSVANTTANWPDATTTSGVAEKHNANVVTFPTATVAWGTVVAYAVMDASTAGNIVIWGALSGGTPVNNGDTPSFAAGTLVFNAD